MRSKGPLSLIITALALSFLTSFARAGDGKGGDIPKGATTVAPDHARAMAKGLDLFKTSVRPLLVTHCLKCHGGESTKGEFDLSTREALLKEGTQGPNVVLGKASESRLVQMLDGKEKPRMPYKAPALAAAEIDQIRRWIDAGAPFDRPLVDAKTTVDRSKVGDESRQFWSFRPLVRHQPPVVRDQSWPKNAVDQFVLAKLEANGLKPTAEADRRVLIRRASFDLIGLPPSPSEIALFINDQAPNAYVRMIDRLLNSNHHGERWARHWLDLARFGESHGYEQDYDRPHAYHYRDFLIRAFNSDIPFDRFVKLQIAGDEFEPENPEALRATGYLGAGTHATQITANQVEKERYDELDDMAANIGTTMLGLTVGCARCHDHKFDPIPTNDYYRLISTFTTTVRSEQEIDPDPALTQRQKAEHNAKHAPLVKAREAYEKTELPKALTAWLASGKPAPRPRWLILEPLAKSAGGATFEKQNDGSFLVTGTNPKNDTYTFTAKIPAGLKLTSLKLEALSHPSLVKGGPGRAENGNFALSTLKISTGGDKPVELKLSKPRATFEQKGLAVAAAIDADATSAWAVDPQFGKDHAAAFDFEQPVSFAKDTDLTITLRFNNNDKHSIGRPRLSVSTEPAQTALTGESARLNDVVGIADLIKKAPSSRTPAETDRLLSWFRTIDPTWNRLNAAVVASEQAAPKPKLVKMQITSEGVPAIRFHTQGGDFFEKTYFLKRGDLAQKNGEAPAGFLQVLTTASEGEKRWRVEPPSGSRTSFRRRALADWITDVDGGAGRLLARVIVNRLWLHHMGRGIVNTPSDFGTQGERPTHPELLDYLATELIREGWRLKPIHKLILTSATYRQSVTTDPDRQKRDADGALYSHRLHQRLSAEAIRDAMLALSGSIDLTPFGPGSLDEGQKRRSIYYTIKRSQLIPLMMLFDAPDSLQGIGKRPNTTVAPQALAMLNNQQIRKYAAGFATATLPATRISASEGVRKTYEKALGRTPTETELVDSLDFLLSQTERYRAQGKPDPLLLALTDFCQSLMCLNEFVYVD